MADDQDLALVRDGTAWSWRWHAPSGATVVSPQSYPRKRVALAAGRQWVREHH